MVRDLLFLMTFLSFPLFASEKLPPLSDKDMYATAGDSPQHSYYAKQNFQEMHKSGDTWEDAKLEKIFLEGLFQHYTYQFTGFDYTLNYNQFISEKAKKAKFTMGKYEKKQFTMLFGKNDLNVPLFESFSKESDDAINIAMWFKVVGDALKENAIFKTLGGQFQRNKIIVEKIGAALSKESQFEQKEKLYKELLKKDREATDEQVLLYHWMKETYAKACQVLKEAYKNKEIPTDKHELLEQVKNSYPDFAYWPAYKKLLKNLPEKKKILRKYDELENQLLISISEKQNLNFKNVVNYAQQAFKEQATEEDYKKYENEFEKLKRELEEKLDIIESEQKDFNIILGNLIQNYAFN